MHGDRGQATAEYIAVLAVLAVLLGATGAVVAPGGIANAVLGQMRRALCVVSGSACPAQRPPPCVVRAESKRRRVSVTVGVIRLDDEHVLLRERLSDGSFRLTVVKESGTGAEMTLGNRWQLEVRGRRIGVGAQLRAALLGILGDGRVYLAPDERAADALQKRLKAGVPFGLDAPLKIAKGLFGGGDDPPPEPDQVYAHAGLKADGALDLTTVAGELALEAMGKAVLGARRDRRTGALTLYLRTERSAGALAAAVLGVGGRLEGVGLLALTLDRDRRPVDLALLASGEARNTPLPGSLAALLKGPKENKGSLSTRFESGRRWELEAHLDVRDPEAEAAWAAFRRAPFSLSAVSTLGARLRDRARLDVRSYATTSKRSGGDVHIGYGVGAGAGYQRLEEGARLIAASSRPAGGAWELRADCVAP